MRKLKISILIWVEFAVLLIALILILLTYQRLLFINGKIIDVDEKNIASISEFPDFDRNKYLSLQYGGCNSSFNVDFILTPNLNKNIIQTLVEVNSSSDSLIYPIRDRKFPCSNLALCIPGQANDVLFHHSNIDTFSLVKKNTPKFPWIDIYIDSTDVHMFKGILSFNWSNSIVASGKYEFSLVIPIASLFDDTLELNESQVMYNFKIRVPESYVLVGYNYPQSQTAKLTPPYPPRMTYSFRAGPLLGEQPLILRFENQSQLQNKMADITLYSTLFGLWIGLFAQAIITLIKEILTLSKTKHNTM